MEHAVTTGVSKKDGYFHHYLARMAPTPLPPPPLPFPASTRRPLLPSRLGGDCTVTNHHRKTKSKPVKKALVDAFKQHGMKLCDGAKLNAVSKGITVIGAIPPTLGIHITALYLSQNDLTSLAGIEQFTSVRLLSVAANMLTHFANIERLQPLKQLRQLNASGNPLCDHPNYRFRVVDALPQVQVLDTVDVPRHERELAPHVASQDRALRKMAMKNHIEIQKLQRLATWILVLGELRTLVIRDAVTGRFDQLPSPLSQGEMAIDQFLRLWRVEEQLSRSDRDAVEAQMMRIVARAKAKLAEETPKVKATTMLLKLANATTTTPVRQRGGSGMNGPSAETRREFALWEDAFAHVLQLQQQAIASARGECDRSVQNIAQAMRQLVVVNPFQRKAVGVARGVHKQVQVEERAPPPPPVSEQQRSNQQDPANGQSVEALDKESDTLAKEIATKEPKPRPDSLRRVLRAGDFGNKTLREAVASFRLREPSVTSRPSATRTISRPQLVTSHAHASPPQSSDGQIKVAKHGMAMSFGRTDRRMSCLTVDSEADLLDAATTESVLSVDSRSCESKIQRTAAVSCAKLSHPKELVTHHVESPPQELHTVHEEDDDDAECYDHDPRGYHHHHRHSGRMNDSAVHEIRRERAERERQHELDTREAKYVQALMDSEQRELDLRHQIHAMDKQLSRFQQLVDENEAERRQIKHEIEQRIFAVARPLVLRRFLHKWIESIVWFRQLRHVQRKRVFIIQHDTFWNWRRTVWATQELRRQRRRHELRLLHSHLTEWANVTRIGVIAIHTQALRHSQLLKRVLSEWRQQARINKIATQIQEAKAQSSVVSTVASIFREWRLVAARQAQLQRMQEFYRRAAATTSKRLILTHWRLFVRTIARPQHHRVDEFSARCCSQRKRRHLRAWLQVTKCEALHRRHYRYRAWTAWAASFKAKRIQSHQSAEKARDVMVMHLVEWHRVAMKRLAVRRAIALATRQRTQRWLRKLWMHWKIFSIAHKRYSRGKAKARRHQVSKLLRRSWLRWRQETRANLVSLRHKKNCELRFHFHAFCQGVKLISSARHRLVFVQHAIKRQAHALVRKVFASWRSAAARRGRCRVLYRVLATHRSHSLRGFVWARWRQERVRSVLLSLQHVQHQLATEATEKSGVHKELLEVNDRSITLSERVHDLTQRVEKQTAEIATYQRELFDRERAVVELETEVASLNRRLQRTDAAREEESDRQRASREQEEIQTRELMDENARLKQTVRDLERTRDAGENRLAEATRRSEELHAEAAIAREKIETAAREFEAREQSMRTSIQELHQRLEVEQREREETVWKLQQYEARIASTCAEIGDHEKAHEQECMRFRLENSRIEAMWKEETVRNAELQKLLQEKNDQIITLSTSKRFDVPVAKVTAPASWVCGDGDTEGLRSQAKKEIQGNPSDVAVAVAPMPEQQLHAVDAVPVTQMIAAMLPTDRNDDEQAIDDRTSRIHADLQLLQERITQRLQQAPCVPMANDQPWRSQVRVWRGPPSSVTESDAEPVTDDSATPVAKKKKQATACKTRTGARQKPLNSDAENVGRAANRLASASRVARPAPPPKQPLDLKRTPNTKRPSVRSTKTRPSQVTFHEHRAVNVEMSDAADDSLRSSPPASSPRLSVPFTETSPPKKKQASSPSKQLHGIDVSTSSLAAISARVMPLVPLAELEIARLRRELQARGHSPRRSGPADAESTTQSSVSPTDGSNQPDSTDQAPASVAQSPTALTSAIKSTTGSALHDSMLAEEWVNLHLESSGAYLLPAADLAVLLQRPDVNTLDDNDDGASHARYGFRRDTAGPLARAGIDRWTLYKLGMPQALVDRLYRALYVYTNGFHSIINEIASHCPPSVEKHVSSNVWLTFLLLLEQCENGKYEMAMLKFKQATQAWQQQMQQELTEEKLHMDAQRQALEAQLLDEQARSHDKSELIAKLAQDASHAQVQITELHTALVDSSEQLRLARLEILVHEDTETRLNLQLDDARKDYEVANAERFNALTEKYVLEEEIRKLERDAERLEHDKANYAKRMHETLFMNQALRATNETLKQQGVVLGVEKAKLEQDKQAALDRTAELQQQLADLKLLKADVESELLASTRRQAHVEERARATQEQLTSEMEHAATLAAQLAHVHAALDEEKVTVGMLEAKCNLLTAEKQNTGMRAQDKLRIERLLNQKLELENQLETLKLERTKDQEQIWNLRASLEALDAELQQTKRVFSAGQQAFLHSERSAEQLRHQLQDVEKNYEKASKNLTSLRERFKLFEESSKEQVVKLEVELKVTSAQLREMTYVSRDNAAVSLDLRKTLEVAEKEAKALAARLTASERQCEQLRNVKEDLQRESQQRDQQSSSTKQTLTKFIRELQAMLALVKADEYPLDDALRELLRLVHATFAGELEMARVLEEEDEPLDFEEEYEEEEFAEEERRRQDRLGGRRAGFNVSMTEADACVDSKGGGGEDAANGLSSELLESSGNRRLTTKVSRMSKYRRSKLDSQVKKLQRELALSSDMVRSLEGVVCTQADEIATVRATEEKQRHWLRLNEHQKGMLLADSEGLQAALADACARDRKARVALQEAQIELVMESNRTFQLALQLQSVRRQFDMHGAAVEDLLGSLRRAYDHEQYMRSLRRDEAIQATVDVAEQGSQTLVPQRNPALEHVRVSVLTLPSAQAPSSVADVIVKQIPDATRVLLPSTAASTVELHRDLLSLSMVSSSSAQSNSSTVLPPFRGQPPTQRTRTTPRQQHQQHRRRQQQQRHAADTTRPPLPQSAAPPPQLVRQYNEFGTRQDVLVSPVYPPFFPGANVASSAPHKRVPTKPTTSSPRVNHIHLGGGRGGGGDPEDGWSPRVTHQQHTASGGVQYHRFLRAGLEVLHSGGQQPEEREEEEEEYYIDDVADREDKEEDEGEDGRWRGSRASLHSPSQLELAVREYRHKLDGRQSSAPPPSRYYSHRLKEDESRGSLGVGQRGRGGADEGEVEEEEEEDVEEDPRHSSRFTPGVLYPILPPR